MNMLKQIPANIQLTVKADTLKALPTRAAALMALQPVNKVLYKEIRYV